MPKRAQYRIVFTGLFALFSMPLHAFPCFLTLVKDTCWTNYNVTVTALRANNGKSLTQVTIPQGKSWARQPFDCEPAEELSFTAVFSPIFWASDKGKTYAVLNSRLLPSTIKKGETAWSLTLCYPADFSGVPLPPDAGEACHCDMA